MGEVTADETAQISQKTAMKVMINFINIIKHAEISNRFEGFFGHS
jgi:hypothetical protein